MSIRSRTAFSLFALLVATPLLLPEEALAQRRVIGSEPADEEEQEEPPAEKTDAEKEARKKKAEEEKKRREEEAKKKAEEKARQEAARKAAEEAAQRAAEEAERKRREEEQRKADEAAKKKAEEEKKRREAELRVAASRRSYVRVDGKLAANLALEPGKVEKGKVLELRVFLGEKLDVPHPRYGDVKPLEGLRLVATVREPVTGQKAPPEHRYVVHPLVTPGLYGFHHTPRVEGEHLVRIEGRTQGDDAFAFEIPIHVGVWPPPDLDAEKENAEALAVSGGRRRPVGGR